MNKWKSLFTNFLFSFIVTVKGVDRWNLFYCNFTNVAMKCKLLLLNILYKTSCMTNIVDVSNQSHHINKKHLRTFVFCTGK